MGLIGGRVTLSAAETNLAGQTRVSPETGTYIPFLSLFSVEQLVVHARIYLGRGEQLPYSIGVPLVLAFEEAVAEVKRLRELVVDREQERFE